MGLIPRTFIDELLNQTNIVDFIDGYVPLKKQGSSFVACCPFHQEKNPSFHVIAKKQFYHCFGCGVSGNAISFAMQYLNQNFSEAVETLAARSGMQVLREGDTTQRKDSINLYQLLARVAQFYQKILAVSGQPAQHYLSLRGVSGDVISRYQLGFAPDGWHALDTANLSHYQAELITTGMRIKKDTGGTYDRYRGRLMFPIHDRNGRIIGFGGRALDAETKPKYLNSPETLIFQKNRELYGLHQVLQLHATPTCIIVVEGYMDVIALAQMGITYAVGTLGTTASTYHMQLLAKHTARIVFCFDGDQAGRKAAWRALENTLPALNTGLDAAFIFLPEGHDPDSFVRAHGSKSFLDCLDTAITLNQLFFNTLLLDINLQTLAGKSQLIHKAKPYLLKLPDGPYRHLLVEELARHTHLEAQRIEQLLTTTDTSAMPAPKPSIIKRTPLRLAIALVLQHPEIYASLAHQVPSAQFCAKNMATLQIIMRSIENNPTILTATLIEQFRDTEFFTAVNQLAVWDHQVPPDALTKELLDTLRFLANKATTHEIDALIQRARQHTLAESERIKLQRLLQSKHQAKIT